MEFSSVSLQRFKDWGSFYFSADGSNLQGKDVDRIHYKFGTSFVISLKAQSHYFPEWRIDIYLLPFDLKSNIIKL
jgi:hypothetical protein